MLVITELYRYYFRYLVFIWCLNLWKNSSQNTTKTNTKAWGEVSQNHTIPGYLHRRGLYLYQSQILLKEVKQSFNNALLFGCPATAKT